MPSVLLGSYSTWLLLLTESAGWDEFLIAYSVCRFGVSGVTCKDVRALFEYMHVRGKSIAVS